MPFMVMEHEVDPAQEIHDRLGDIESMEIFNNQILCATYIRTKKTAKGVILPDSYVDEDKYQGKVGLIVKMGPDAFIDPTGKWFREDLGMEIGQWIVYRPSDGWSLGVNGVDCRMLDDTNVRARIPHPDFVW